MSAPNNLGSDVFSSELRDQRLEQLIANVRLASQAWTDAQNELFAFLAAANNTPDPASHTTTTSSSSMDCCPPTSTDRDPPTSLPSPLPLGTPPPSSAATRLEDRDPLLFYGPGGYNSQADNPQLELLPAPAPAVAGQILFKGKSYDVVVAPIPIVLPFMAEVKFLPGITQLGSYSTIMLKAFVDMVCSQTMLDIRKERRKEAYVALLRAAYLVLYLDEEGMPSTDNHMVTGRVAAKALAATFEDMQRARDQYDADEIVRLHPSFPNEYRGGLSPRKAAAAARNA